MDLRETKRAQRKKKRKKRNAIALAAVAAVVVIAIAVMLSGRSSHDGTLVRFEVAKGETPKAIAATLKENGLIGSTSGFLRDVKKSGSADSLRYGTYEIERGASNSEIIELLLGGGNVKTTVTVTIPEGYSLEKIIEKLVESGLSDKDSLEAAVNADYDYDFLTDVPSGVKYRLQGFLFPTTYEFEPDADAETIINTMLAEFDKQITKSGISRDNLFETVTLASLVEREAKLDDERATIAGVIENRIKKGMRLQIDATVVYAISDGMYDVDRVLYKDLETDSPYNTYKNSGLPVGPICSPGLKSLLAAATPEKHNYLYYRTDSDKADGSHIFTTTFEEHKNAG